MSKLKQQDFLGVETSGDLRQLLRKKGILISDIDDVLLYENQLRRLQIELLKLQKWITRKGKRVAIVFEGRDAAGKGGVIRRFMEHLNPRFVRLVALNKATETEQKQWYFRRYLKQFPNAGEIVFFDRSWYNRAVVEPVMNFCTPDQYEKFINQVPDFEKMLYDDGICLVKFWMSISKDEQQKRFKARQKNPLKRWKFSEVDKKGQELWERYTYYKDAMFSRTNTTHNPWVVVQANDKKKARLEAIRYVLSLFDYDEKSDDSNLMNINPKIIAKS